MALGILELEVLVFFLNNHKEMALDLFVHSSALKPIRDYCRDCFSLKGKPSSLSLGGLFGETKEIDIGIVSFGTCL